MLFYVSNQNNKNKFIGYSSFTILWSVSQLNTINDLSLLMILLQCNNGYAGNGFTCGDDPDLDGYPSEGISCAGEEFGTCSQVCFVRH